MRLHHYIAILLLAFVPIQAEAKKKPTQDQICAVAGSWGKVIMRSRQIGMPLSQVIEIMGNADGGSRADVIRAYETPRYSSGEMQERAVQDFGIEMEMKCYRKAK